MPPRFGSSRGGVLVLAALVAGAPAPAPARGASPPTADGYLRQTVDILVYPSDAGFDESERGWTLRREISLFEGYLWRNSGRHLSVETRLTVIHRPLQLDEFRDYGEQFGFLLDRGPRIDNDLTERGISPSALLLLYDPPPDRPARLAGRTFFEGCHSSIPLRGVYFEQDGFHRPLHLVLAHEYLHRIDIDFSRLHHPGEFLDPDGAGQAGYPSCIDPGGGDLSLRTLLQFNRECGPVQWDLLAPAFGSWVSR
jgi:hypothetical protein